MTTNERFEEIILKYSNVDDASPEVLHDMFELIDMIETLKQRAEVWKMAAKRNRALMEMFNKV